MQLDKTYIAIRERGLLDILDLSLHVIREHAGRLVGTFLIGAAPFIVFNVWLLQLPKHYEPSEWYWAYTFWAVVLLLFEMPLAGAVTTLFLGQTMFQESIDWTAIRRDYFRSLPQMILFQGLLRTIMLVMVITSFLPYAVWAYLSEIILLERNPLRSKGNGISTWKRCKLLHNSNAGDNFVRWMGISLVGLLQVLCVIGALYFLKAWTTGRMSLDPVPYATFLQIGLWSTAFFVTIVRFLCYLDLRIRREGWEVELRMRAEAARLSEQLV